MPGIGRAIFENDFAAEAIEAFMEGTHSRRIPDTVLATVLFTDLVDSTRRAASSGTGLARLSWSGTTRSSGWS